MNFYEEDENDKKQEYAFYDKEVLKEHQKWEEYYDSLNEFTNQYIDKLNEFQIKSEYQSQHDLNPVVKIQQQANETHFGIFDLANTDNKMFNKITTTFVLLEEEVNKLSETFEKNIFDKYVIYGEHINDKSKIQREDNLKDGDAEIETGRMLKTYAETFSLIQRVDNVIFNMVNQLNGVTNKQDKNIKSTFKENNLGSILDSLAEALSLLLTLDTIVIENENIKSHWNFYKRMLKAIKQEPQKFNLNEKQIFGFERIMIQFDRSIIQGKCYELVIKQEFDVKSELQNITLNNIKIQPMKGTINETFFKENKEFQSMLLDYIKEQFSQCSELLNTNRETNERQRLYKMFCLYGLYRNLFKHDEDRKLWKQLWSLQKKVPIICVHSHVLMYIHKFMNDLVPLTKKSYNIDPKDPQKFLKEYLTKNDENFGKQIHSIYLVYCQFIVKMSSDKMSNTCFGTDQIPQNTQLIHERLMFRSKLIMTSFLLSHQIRNLFLTNLLLHLHEQTPLSSQLVKLYCNQYFYLNIINFKQIHFKY